MLSYQDWEAEYSRFPGPTWQIPILAVSQQWVQSHLGQIISSLLWWYLASGHAVQGLI